MDESPVRRMSYYRCYAKDRYGLAKVHSFEAESDSDALAQAEALVGDDSHTGDVFELWNQSRLVHKRDRMSAAAASTGGRRDAG